MPLGAFSASGSWPGLRFTSVRILVSGFWCQRRALDTVTRGYNAAGKIVGWVVIAADCRLLDISRVALDKRTRLERRAVRESCRGSARHVGRSPRLRCPQSRLLRRQCNAASGVREGSNRPALHQPDAEFPSAGTVMCLLHLCSPGTSTRVARELQGMLEGKEGTRHRDQGRSARLGARPVCPSKACRPEKWQPFPYLNSLKKPRPAAYGDEL